MAKLPIFIPPSTHAYAYVLYYVARRNKAAKKPIKKSTKCFTLNRPPLQFFICNRCKFYNFPNIFYWLCPSPNTSHPNNRAPFHRRNRGKLLCRYIHAPILQIFFDIFCICTVIKASLLFLTRLPPLYYTATRRNLQPFPHKKSHFYYKIALPERKLSKKPPTSSPVFSNDPTNSPTPFIAYLVSP